MVEIVAGDYRVDKGGAARSVDPVQRGVVEVAMVPRGHETTIRFVGPIAGVLAKFLVRPPPKEPVLFRMLVVNPVHYRIIGPVQRLPHSHVIVKRLQARVCRRIVWNRHELHVRVIGGVDNPAEWENIAEDRVPHKVARPAGVRSHRERVVQLVFGSAHFQQIAEIALPLRHRGNRVVNAAACELAVIETVVADKEEQLVAAVVDLGNNYRAAQGTGVGVVMSRGLHW